MNTLLDPTLFTVAVLGVITFGIWKNRAEKHVSVPVALNTWLR